MCIYILYIIIFTTNTNVQYFIKALDAKVSRWNVERPMRLPTLKIENASQHSPQIRVFSWTS
jgi:hypothetical protein